MNKKMTRTAAGFMTGRTRFIGILLAFMLVFSLSACRSKQPATAESFTKAMEELGYEVIDRSGQYAGNDRIESCLNVETDNLRVEFYIMTRKDNAVEFYNWNRTQAEEKKDGDSSEAAVHYGNYQRYTLKTADQYYWVSLVGNTVLYAYCDKWVYKDLDDIVKALGY